MWLTMPPLIRRLCSHLSNKVHYVCTLDTFLYARLVGFWEEDGSCQGFPKKPTCLEYKNYYTGVFPSPNLCTCWNHLKEACKLFFTNLNPGTRVSSRLFSCFFAVLRKWQKLLISTPIKQSKDGGKRTVHIRTRLASYNPTVRLEKRKLQ